MLSGHRSARRRSGNKSRAARIAVPLAIPMALGLTLGIIIAVCIVLLILGFLVPRLSRHPQRGVDSTLSVGQKAGGTLPGFLGRWAQKPFGKSRKATNKSAAAGRKGRGKLPG